MGGFPYKIPLSMEELEKYSIFIDQVNGSYYRIGSDETWVLTFDPHSNYGRAELKNGSGGTPDYEEYRNGVCRVHDAWSDNSSSVKLPFSDWVQKWIKQICSDGELIYTQKKEAQKLRDTISKHGKRSVIKLQK